MPNLLVIFGITGQQGSSIVNTILSDPELSNKYRIRGLTRDPTKPEARALASKGIDIVAADLTDRTSIRNALAGAHAVFAMTTSSYAPGGFDAERAQGKAIADECVAAGVQFLVWSTVPSPSAHSRGATPVGSWDLKAEIEAHIRGLPLRAAFFAPGYFMQNMRGMEPLRRQDDGSYAFAGFIAPETRIPMIDIAADTGKFVGAMLADPEEWSGKTMYGASGFWSISERAEALSKATGKTVRYNRVPREVFVSFIPEGIPRESFGNMYDYLEQFGYFGADGEALVKQSVRLARGKTTSLEENLANEPLQLE